MTSDIRFEKIVFNYVLENDELILLIKPKFFKNDFISKVFDLTKEHYKKFSAAPSKNQIFQEGLSSKVLTKDNATELNLLFKEDLNTYTDEWLEKNVKGWIEIKALEYSTINLTTYLKTLKFDLESADEIVSNAKQIFEGGVNLTFDFDEGLDFFDAKNHKQPTWDTFTTGYKYLDLVLGGGWTTKSLYVLAGEMKIGKSLWLANLVANAVKEGHNSAYLSFEMRSEHVVKRIGANMLNISIKEYDQISKNTDLIKSKLGNISYETFKVPGKLQVKEFPTSSASVKDIEKYLVNIEERKGFKFKIIFVDYLNIIMNWRNPNSDNMYMKIKQIAEDLRALGKKHNWAMVSVTQVNRDSFGASGRLKLSSIAESSGLGHTVDWMGGIVQDEVMHANNEYLLQTMLNRNEGYKNSRKRFLVDYEYMRIIEDPESEIIIDPNG